MAYIHETPMRRTRSDVLFHGGPFIERLASAGD
jgi:hypothetical protein